jgi:hypothetical protein
MARRSIARRENAGYVVVYRPGGSNHCPGCGRSHWYVGRNSAECAFCALTLDLVEPMRGSATGMLRG